MIQLFDIQDKRVVPHANAYLIPEIKAAMDYFKDEDLKVLAYIAFMTIPDGSNPYNQLAEDQKESVILSDLKPSFYLDDNLIQKALKKCNELFETPTLRAFKGAKQALDRIAKYLSDTEITDGKEGSALTIERYMSKLAEFTDTYNKLETKLKEEQAKVRGSLKLRYDQQSGYKDLKEDE